MGSAIIQAITSGLSLVGTLATNFLTGFKNLFVVTAEGGSTSLTEFGEYAFVMLGISIVFGMVGLACKLVTKNTGVQ
jgi:hypothetical protein